MVSAAVIALPNATRASVVNGPEAPTISRPTITSPTATKPSAGEPFATSSIKICRAAEVSKSRVKIQPFKPVGPRFQSGVSVFFPSLVRSGGGGYKLKSRLRTTPERLWIRWRLVGWGDFFAAATALLNSATASPSNGLPLTPSNTSPPCRMPALGTPCSIEPKTISRLSASIERTEAVTPSNSSGTCGKDRGPPANPVPASSHKESPQSRLVRVIG